jgi:5-(carboxyamino)imidazole ribonucleotide synthase
MLAMAAARLGIDVHIYAPEKISPAARVSSAFTCAAYDDKTALRAFAEAVDVVTTEFENVPAATCEILADHIPVRPHARALEIAQDRVAEKSFLNEQGIGTAPWRAVTTTPDLDNALAALGTPSILKTRRLGYDGKGQARIMAADDAPAALAEMSAQPAILEGFIAFEREISVIVARGVDGAIACYDPGENEHEDGILRRTTIPAAISEVTREAAFKIARKIVRSLDYIGVMGVEMFVTPEGEILVNEVAPRVHNTGHWTIEGCAISQFEQHVRAVCGWPLGSTERHSDAVMTNLLGAEADDWHALASQPQGVHLYGKGASRPGRKMGHVTTLSPKT